MRKAICTQLNGKYAAIPAVVACIIAVALLSGIAGSSAPQLSEGERIYTSACVACHGADALTIRPVARHAGGGVNSLPLAQLRSAGTRDAGEQSHRDDAGHDRRNRGVLTIELGADCFAHAEGLNPETTKIGSGTHRRRCSCSSNMTKSSSCYVVASIAMKRLLRDSHSVGCAKTPSRSAVY